jgi:hypothetical protein
VLSALLALTLTDRFAEIAKSGGGPTKNYSTPRAAVDVLKAVHAGRGVSSAGRAVLLKDLADSTPGPLRIPPPTTSGSSRCPMAATLHWRCS